MKRRHGHTPKYSLELVQELAAAGGTRVQFTKSAIAGAQALGLEVADIAECVCALTEGDYEQTLESTKIPGTFQDVYKPRHRGFEIYLKVRLIDDRKVLVISFKRNTSP